MKKHLALLLAISMCLLLTGCIELDSVLTINKDGSGTIEETTLLNAQAAAMMSMMATAVPGQPGAAPAPPPDLMVSREKAEATAKEMGPGVTLKTFEALKTPDGKQGQKIVYAFPDISKINYQSGSSASSFSFSNGTLTVRNLSNASKAAAPPLPGAPAIPGRGANTPPPSEQEIAMVKGMFAGMRMALRVTAPGGIASTDATFVDGNTVTLLDLQLDKLFDNPEALAKLSTMSPSPNMSPADAAEVLKAIPGVRAELRDVVTIKLK